MNVKEVLLSKFKDWSQSEYIFNSDTVNEVKKFDPVLAKLLKNQIDGFYEIKNYLRDRMEVK